MDAGEFDTVTDLAKAVGLAERYVSRQLRLACYDQTDLVARNACPSNQAAG